MAKNENNELLLSMKNLDAWYTKGKLVLKDLNIELFESECVGLIGLNGAGKTTFMKIISGLHTSYSFEQKRYNGSDVDFRSDRFKIERFISFSEDNTFSYLTFNEYLRYVLKSYKKEKVDVSHLIKGFNFENYKDVLIKELSTGNKKKASLIVAFALKPKLLLLDEPVNGLDFESTEFLYKLMQSYKKHGTIVFSSHILESICFNSDRVLILQDGRITKKFEEEEIDSVTIREALNFDD